MSDPVEQAIASEHTQQEHIDELVQKVARSFGLSEATVRAQIEQVLSVNSDPLTAADLERDLLQNQILMILERYRVQKHYRSSSEGGGTRYKVFSGAPIDGTLQQHGDAMGHAAARRFKDELTARDIIKLVSRPQNVAGLMGGPNR